MTDLERQMLLQSMDVIHDAPDWSQPLNLLIACKADTTNTVEPIARILAKYGVSPEKVMPCILELMKTIVLSDHSSNKTLPEHGS